MNETLISCHNIILFPFSAHLANPVWGVYLEAQAVFCDGDFTIEIYGTVEYKVIKAMNGAGFHVRSLKQN